MIPSSYSLVQCLSIAPGQISHYAVSDRPRNYNFKRIPNQSKNRNMEVLNRKRKRLMSAVSVMYDSAVNKKCYCADGNYTFFFKLNFITLTLPSAQVLSDVEIHNKIFKEFIRNWKRKEVNLLYVYRVEVQDNGNLHYHLLTNSFYHQKNLRIDWNYYCNKGGQKCSGFENSTDVHALNKITNVKNYVAKYMGKKDEYKKRCSYPKSNELVEVKNGVFFERKREIVMKSWDCSAVIKKVKKVIIECPDDDVKEECRTIAKSGKSTTKKYDYCTIQSITNSSLNDTKLIKQEYKKIMNDVVEINKKVKYENVM